MENLRFLAACLALGLIGDWASETLFWSAPPGPVLLAERTLTVLAYALAAGAGLSAALLTGCGGWRAAFLGGAILGFTVEGGVVGTMYQALPFQLVWTPLAWHALISGGVVLALSRSAGRLPAWKLAAGWLAVGVFGGLWAWYWPLERGEMPSAATTLAYLAGLGLAVPAGNVLLDRLGAAPLRPPRWVLLAPPVLVALLWLAGTLAASTPVRLAMPAMTGLAVLAMLRQRGGAQGFGQPAPLPKHLLFLIAPLTAGLVGPAGWALGGAAVNIPVALVTGSTATLAFIALIVRRWRSI